MSITEAILTCPKDVTTMISIASYHVVVATEETRRASAQPRYQSIPPKRPSRLASIFSTVLAPVRRSAASAA